MQQTDHRPVRTGILGGTFNPIHIGHLALAQWALEEASLDEILFIPTGHPYMKEGQELTEGSVRLHMVELAVADREEFLVSDMEIRRQGYTYTCDTVEQLHREHPEREYYFILGADCLDTIERWKDPERIFAACQVIAGARNGSSQKALMKKCRFLQETFGARIQLLHFPELTISSSMVRERAEEGKSIQYLVPEAVRQFIREKGLYRS